MDREGEGKRCFYQCDEERVKINRQMRALRYLIMKPDREREREMSCSEARCQAGEEGEA